MPNVTVLELLDPPAEYAFRNADDATMSLEVTYSKIGKVTKDVKPTHVEYVLTKNDGSSSVVAKSKKFQVLDRWDHL
jgi:bisphosphoglycerate-independent phosphoglycerate mutase (AlkP superfamily)